MVAAMERTDLVVQAQTGDLEAYGRLVRDTQAMVYAVALAILRDPGRAEDAAQETFLRAFRSLSRLQEAPAFTTWLRRIAINVAMNLRRSERTTLLRLDDVPEIPVLDEAEAAWSERQRQRLAAALVTLSEEERALSDLRYHGRWSFARLAASRGVSEPVIRKRLQRIRDKLRKEMELMEQKGIETGPDLPAKIVELLARPRLTDLPENPVGQTIARIRGAFADFDEIDLPEVVDLAEAQKTAANAAVYVKPDEIHRLDENRVLRYDLTLPLLQAVRYENQPLRLWAAGKVYRSCSTDATHLEAFHQAELLWVDERERIDSWTMAGRILKSIDQVLPGSEVRIVPTKYPMCSQAWELEVEKDGNCVEVLAWGVFANGIVRHLRADPRRVSAIGVGYGLDRLAMLRYDIDDIRKVESASVA
jgi:RNA polymerase sigma-70 factor (ECF subfamily)